MSKSLNNNYLSDSTTNLQISSLTTQIATLQTSLTTLSTTTLSNYITSDVTS